MSDDLHGPSEARARLVRALLEADSGVRPPSSPWRTAADRVTDFRSLKRGAGTIVALAAIGGVVMVVRTPVQQAFERWRAQPKPSAAETKLTPNAPPPREQEPAPAIVEQAPPAADLSPAPAGMAPPAVTNGVAPPAAAPSLPPATTAPAAPTPATSAPPAVSPPAASVPAVPAPTPAASGPASAPSSPPTTAPPGAATTVAPATAKDRPRAPDRAPAVAPSPAGAAPESPGRAPLDVEKLSAVTEKRAVRQPPPSEARDEPGAATGSGAGTAENLPAYPVNERIPPLATPFPLTAGARIVLDLEIDEEGRVLSAKVRESAAGTLDSTLLAAARRWRYRPATRGGVPVRSTRTVVVPVSPE
jgi:periplasmic protein TonB